jgi:hypothetical protein
VFACALFIETYKAYGTKLLTGNTVGDSLTFKKDYIIAIGRRNYKRRFLGKFVAGVADQFKFKI